MNLTVPPTPQRVFSRPVITTVARALVEAWRRLPTENFGGRLPFKPSDYKNEDEVTTRLVLILNHMLADQTVSGFSEDIFQDVARDSKVVSHDGRRKEMMPDMRFALVFKPAHFMASRHEAAFLAEAKVFAGKSRGLPKYFSEGVQRFVDGRYAPKTDVGMMVAYCTDPARWPFPGALDLFLGKRIKCVINAKGTGGVTTLPDVLGVPWGVSKHKRDFDPAAPHEFELHHLWLNVPSS